LARNKKAPRQEERKEIVFFSFVGGAKKHSFGAIILLWKKLLEII